MNTATSDTTAAAITPPFLYNIHAAVEAVTAHYGIPFKNLRLIPPGQVTDGSSAEFIDDETSVVVATARMRFVNTVYVNASSGDMFVDVKLSDLTYGHAPVKATSQTAV